MNHAPRIHFLLVRRTPPGPGPVLTEVYERPQAQGAAIDDHIPEDRLLSRGELVVTHDLYGVDLIETEEGSYVIEVNCFPGYKGVPEADRLLAEYIFERAAGSPETRSSNVAQAVESSP